MESQGTDSTQFFSKRALRNLEFHGDHTQIASSFKSFHLSSLLKPDFGDLAVFRSPFGQFVIIRTHLSLHHFRHPSTKVRQSPYQGFASLFGRVGLFAARVFFAPRHLGFAEYDTIKFCVFQEGG